MPSEKQPKQPPADPKPSPGQQPHYVADEPVADPASPDATVRSPTTETGLPVEEQIRKEWDPKRQGGLPTSVKPRSR
jgi:hypothetical protein